MTATLIVGFVVGAALWRVVRLIIGSRAALTVELAALYRPPRRRSRQAGPAGWLAHHLDAVGVRPGVGLVDDLVVVDRSAVEHVTAQVTHTAIAAAGTVAFVVVAGVVGVRVPVVIVVATVVVAAVGGLLVADRRVHAAARARRRELRQAVAAYLDLVRILVAGHLPVNAAVLLAADPGSGWAFTQLRDALATAADQHLPVSVGFEHLAARYPISELRELAATITVAERRGGDPIRALGDRAGFLRGAELATSRSELAEADAAIQLPAVVIAFGFLAFLAFPLVHLVTTIGTTRPP